MRVQAPKRGVIKYLQGLVGQLPAGKRSKLPLPIVKALEAGELIGLLSEEHRLVILEAVSSTIMSELREPEPSEEDLCQRLLTVVVDGMAADVGAVILQDLEQKFPRVAALHDVSPQMCQDCAFGSSMNVEAPNPGGQPLLLTALGPDSSRLPLCAREDGMGSVIQAPLWIRESYVGWMHVGAIRGRHFTDFDIQLVKEIAERISLALGNFDSTRQIKAANHQLQASQILARDYTNAAAHDIRAPLAIIAGHAQLLKRQIGTGKTESLMGSCDVILRNVKRMEAMIRDMLDAARLDTKITDLNLAPLELAGFVKTYLQTAAEVAPRRDDFRLETLHSAMVVRADAACLERILENLISNALKFSREGIPVTIRLESRVDQAVIHVEDQGVGITQEELPHIFDRFYRVKSSPTKEGVGLGLFIVKNLVEAHGGTVWAVSEVGKGTTVSFTLPLVP
ncbi:MAG: GAF domain-containing sensor histidine kinase [Chloroflexi bacterium]|nr:GAF domain-containing sensor histidine kinase [Chloroflexota bacterium]